MRIICIIGGGRWSWGVGSHDSRFTIHLLTSYLVLLSSGASQADMNREWWRPTGDLWLLTLDLDLRVPSAMRNP